MTDIKEALPEAPKLDMSADKLAERLAYEIEETVGDLMRFKKNLTKNELVGIIRKLVGYPFVEQEHELKGAANSIVISACNAKQTLVNYTVQMLVEEGKNQENNKAVGI